MFESEYYNAFNKIYSVPLFCFRNYILKNTILSVVLQDLDEPHYSRYIVMLWPVVVMLKCLKTIRLRASATTEMVFFFEGPKTSHYANRDDSLHNTINWLLNRAC